MPAPLDYTALQQQLYGNGSAGPYGGFNYTQAQGAMGADPTKGPEQSMINTLGAGAGGPGQPMGAGAGGPAPPTGTTGDPSQGYSADQFNQWFASQYGQLPGQDLMTTIGTAVGAPAGPNGTFSQAQWEQAQQMAGRAQQGFFPEFQGPTYEAGASYQAPVYNAPQPFEAPQPFSYGDFRAPTQAEAQNDPGYQFALQQGLGALQGSAAARGLTRTGGTLKALMDYGQNAAAQQYGNVYNRAAQTYGMNRSNAAETYARNYDIARNTWQDNANLGLQAFRTNADVGRQSWLDNETARQGAYDRNYRAAQDAYNARFRGRELTFEDLFRRWQTQLSTNTQLALAD